MDKPLGNQRKPWAFSLVEIALAFGLIAVAAVPAISLVIDTQKRAHKVTETYREVTLAQMIWEGFKNRLALNPYLITNLQSTYQFQKGAVTNAEGTLDVLEHTASVWDLDSPPRDAAGNAIHSSFMTHYLLNPSESSLYTVEKRELKAAGEPTMRAAIEQLLSNYRDLVYKITVAPGPFGVIQDEEGGSTRTVGRDEWTRHVRIAVHKIPPSGVLDPEPTYALETAIETPAESLSLEAARARQEGMDDYNYGTESAETFLEIAFSATAAGLDAELVQALSDLSLMFSQAVGEAKRVEDDDLGFELVDEIKGIDFWISTLNGVGSAYAMRRIADLQERKAQIIFESFRRSYKPMENLAAYTQGLRDLAQRVSDQLRTYENALASVPAMVGVTAETLYQQRLAAQVGASLAPIVLLLEKLYFWKSFFEVARYRRGLERPLTWRASFEMSIRDAIDLRRNLDGDERLTALEKLSNVRRYLDIVKALKMLVDQPTIPEEGFIRTVRERSTPYELPFAESLVQDNLGDLDQLKQWNVAFVKIRDQLNTLASPDNVFGRTIENFDAIIRLADEVPRQLVVLGQNQQGGGKSWGGDDKKKDKTNDKGQDGGGGGNPGLSADSINSATSAAASAADSAVGTVSSSESIDFKKEGGASPGILALRDIMIQVSETGELADLMALALQVQALQQNGGLDPVKELGMGSLVLERIKTKVMGLTGGDGLDLPPPPDPPRPPLPEIIIPATTDPLIPAVPGSLGL